MVRYFKGQTTEYIFRQTAGKLSAEGPGLSFFYLSYNTQIVAVPTSSVDANFVFNEVTKNFQEVTIQGQLAYRIHSPRQAAALLNFTIDPVRRSYVSTDPEKLSQRICNIVQMETRSEIRRRTMEEAITDSQSIAASVLQSVQGGGSLGPLGVEVLSVYFLSTRPTPEVAKALEAEYRENLLRKADEAIAARRAAAVDDERKIKEKQLASDLALEQGRKELIALQGENERMEAENRGQALEIVAASEAKAAELNLAAYRTADPRNVVAMALKQLGENASNIGNLTISTEVLAELLKGNSVSTAGG